MKQKTHPFKKIDISQPAMDSHTLSNMQSAYKKSLMVLISVYFAVQLSLLFLSGYGVVVNTKAGNAGFAILLCVLFFSILIFGTALLIDTISRMFESGKFDPIEDSDEIRHYKELVHLASISPDSVPPKVREFLKSLNSVERLIICKGEFQSIREEQESFKKYKDKNGTLADLKKELETIK